MRSSPEAHIEVVGENLNYEQMRGLEQLMIEINGGVSSLANKINGISATNPQYNTYIDAAWWLF